MKTPKIILIVLMFFQAVSAIGGGIGLLIDVSGESLGFSLDMLAGSPFASFLIPGLFLLIVLGIIPLILGISLIKNWKFANLFSILIGMILVLWIIVEVIIIRDTGALHYVYLIVGILILLFGFLSKRK